MKLMRVGISTSVCSFYSAIAYFSKIDADSDGMISLTEASAYLGQHPVVRRDVAKVNPKWFADIDINGDGHISPAEFDSDLD